MCTLYFATFDHLHDVLVLVLDQFVHLHLVDDSVCFEIIFIGFSPKNLYINMCILYFATFDHLHDVPLLVLDQSVLHLVDDFMDFEIISNGFSSKN